MTVACPNTWHWLDISSNCDWDCFAPYGLHLLINNIAQCHCLMYQNLVMTHSNEEPKITILKD